MLKVVSVENAGIAYHYDLCVPGYANFLAAGVVHHNSSKTYSAMSEFCSWILGERPWDGSPTRTPTPNDRWLIVAPSYTTAVPDLIEPELMRRLGHVITDVSRNNQKALVTAYLKTGGYVRINTFEQYLKNSREQTTVFMTGHYTGALFDEVPPREVWVACKRGLVTGRSQGWGKAIIAATPDKDEFGWVFDDLYSQAHNKGGHERRIWATEFSIYDNPSNTQDAIESLSQGLTDEEREAIIYGRFRHVAGRVFKTFKEEQHVVSWEALSDANGLANDWPIIHSCDPHQKLSPFMLWFAIDPDGGWHAVREWPTQDFARMSGPVSGYTGFDGIARAIAEVEATLTVKGKMGDYGVGKDRVRWRVMDPRFGGSGTIATGERLIADIMYEDHGYDFDTDVANTLDEGHHLIHDKLSLFRPKEPPGPGNRPKFLIHATPENPMSNLIWSFLHYVHAAQKAARSAVMSRRASSVSEAGKHAIDALRYALMLNVMHTDWRRSTKAGRGAMSEHGRVAVGRIRKSRW